MSLCKTHCVPETEILHVNHDNLSCISFRCFVIHQVIAPLKSFTPIIIMPGLNTPTEVKITAAGTISDHYDSGAVCFIMMPSSGM